MSDVVQEGGAPAVETPVTPETGSEVVETPAEGAEEGTSNPVAEALAEAEAASKDKKAAPKAETKDQKKLKEEIRKFKLKIDGKDEELPEEEVLKFAQLGKAGQKRMQEAAELRKNVEKFIETLRTDPLKVLADPNLQIDPSIRKAMAERIIQGEIEEMQKSPEQREKEKLSRELEDLKKKYETEETTRKQKEFQRLQEQAAVQYDRDITDALSESGLPKSPYTVKKMAETMLLALKNKIEITPKEAVGLIKKQMQSEIREMFQATPEDVIEEFLGQDNIQRLRKKQLAKLKQAPAKPSDVKPTGQDVKKPDEKAKDKIPMRDFWKQVGKW